MESETREFLSMLKLHTNAMTINKSMAKKYTTSITISISDLWPKQYGEQSKKRIELNYNPKYIYMLFQGLGVTKGQHTRIYHPVPRIDRLPPPSL